MDQQWEPVVLRKKTVGGGKGANTSAVNAARQHGQQVESIKKVHGGANKTGGPSNARKLDEEDTDFRHQKVPLELRKALQQARQAKKLSQKDLATRLNEKVSVVNDYESGKAIPSGGMIARMERILETKLPRPPKVNKKKTVEE